MVGDAGWNVNKFEVVAAGTKREQVAKGGGWLRSYIPEHIVTVVASDGAAGKCVV